MEWSDVRAAYPEQWLVIETLETHDEDDVRVFYRVAVVETCEDGRAAMKRYRELRHAQPTRELCFVHTSNVQIRVEERVWFGVRGLREPESSI